MLQPSLSIVHYIVEHQYARSDSVNTAPYETQSLPPGVSAPHETQSLPPRVSDKKQRYCE